MPRLERAFTPLDIPLQQLREVSVVGQAQQLVELFEGVQREHVGRFGKGRILDRVSSHAQGGRDQK
ncbi:MAG: hypothetical protein ACI8QZ_000555 [Chlamydiales bacterium]